MDEAEIRDVDFEVMLYVIDENDENILTRTGDYIPVPEQGQVIDLMSFEFDANLENTSPQQNVSRYRVTTVELSYADVSVPEVEDYETQEFTMVVVKVREYEGDDE